MKVDIERFNVVSTYIEEGEINILIGTDENCEDDVRWHLVIDQETGGVKGMERWVSVNGERHLLT